MGQLDKLTQTMRNSNDLWLAGQPRSALKNLEEAIQEASQQNQNEWVQTLCRQAARISEEIGDLPLARRYNEDALRHGPNNPMALYALAKILAEQGEGEQARLYAIKCVEVVSRSGSEIHQGVLDLIAKRWPEVVERHRG